MCSNVEDIPKVYLLISIRCIDCFRAESKRVNDILNHVFTEKH